MNCPECNSPFPYQTVFNHQQRKNRSWRRCGACSLRAAAKLRKQAACMIIERRLQPKEVAAVLGLKTKTLEYHWRQARLQIRASSARWLTQQCKTTQ